ncbi:MAG: hypothetical protein Q8R76_08830 [Candidatus Omnitrophota bacterium]|nr:hypothetical protein [Candidatus Omnitrophota bacterium]
MPHRSKTGVLLLLCLGVAVAALSPAANYEYERFSYKDARDTKMRGFSQIQRAYVNEASKIFSDLQVWFRLPNGVLGEDGRMRFEATLELNLEMETKGIKHSYLFFVDDLFLDAEGKEIPLLAKSAGFTDEKGHIKSIDGYRMTAKYARFEIVTGLSAPLPRTLQLQYRFFVRKGEQPDQQIYGSIPLELHKHRQRSLSNLFSIFNPKKN